MVQIFILLCTRILLLWNEIQSQIYSCYSNNSEEKLSCIMIFKLNLNLEVLMFRFISLKKLLLLFWTYFLFIFFNTMIDRMVSKTLAHQH